MRYAICCVQFFFLLFLPFSLVRFGLCFVCSVVTLCRLTVSSSSSSLRFFLSWRFFFSFVRVSICCEFFNSPFELALVCHYVSVTRRLGCCLAIYAQKNGIQNSSPNEMEGDETTQRNKRKKRTTTTTYRQSDTKAKTNSISNNNKQTTPISNK